MNANSYLKRIAIRVAVALVFVSVAGTLSAGNDMSFRKINAFRPNYFIAGVPTNQFATKDNFDIKFQISLKFDICQTVRERECNVFFGYTQVSLWNIFAYSSPFRENVYAPGLYCSLPFDILGRDEPMGRFLYGLVHRSNGRDDAFSRSINYIMADYQYPVNRHFEFEVAARCGFGFMGQELSQDMFRYQGYFGFSATYTDLSGDLALSVSAIPLFGMAIPLNITCQAAYCPFRDKGSPYLFLQFHYGYDEAQCDCVPLLKPVPMLRFGLTLQTRTVLFW